MRRGRLASIAGILALAMAGVGWWYARRNGAAPQSEAARIEQGLRDAVARQPGSATAHRELGRFYLKAQRPFEALWELEQAHSLDPHDAATSVHEATALALAHLYPAAAAQLEQTLAPDSRVGRQELAALFLATARPEQARKVLQAAPGLTDWSEGQLLLGRAYEGLGQVALARRAYEQSTRLMPQGTEAPFRLARLLLTNGQPQAAREMITAAQDRAPREARLLVLLAMTYSDRWGRVEDRDRQGELLSAAMRSSPAGDVPARLALGELYVRHRRFQEGGRLLAPLADRDDLAPAHRGVAAALVGLGQPVEAHYHRGMAAVVEGQADRALTEFQALASGAPDDPRGPQLVSQTYAEMNQLDQSLEAARILYQRGNRSPELLERLATLSLLTSDRRAARRIGEEWQQAQPESGRPLAHLGKVALADLRLPEAVRFYEEAVAKEPKNAQHRLGLVEALSRQPSEENRRRALSLLREAVALAPRDPQPRYQLAVRFQQAGQLEEARQELLRALEEDSFQPAAYSNLVQVAAALRQPALARRFESLMRDVQERRRAREAAWRRRWERPADPQAYYALAHLLADGGGMGSAEQQLQRALELRPGWPEASRLMERLRRLLDGMDPDGRRLVQFTNDQPMATRESAQRGGTVEVGKG